MAKIELYTFGEVVKVLGISSKELNKLIESRKLKPVRHKGRLKFKKCDVEEVRKKFLTYSWDKVLAVLQIESYELERMIEEGEIRVIKYGDEIRFDKKEVERIRDLKQLNATIVVENINQHLPPPEELSHSVEVPIEELAQPAYVIEATEEEEYYTFDEVLSLLQIDSNTLENLLNQGKLTSFHDKGELKFKKKEVEALKNTLDYTNIDNIQPIYSSESHEEDIEPIVIMPQEEKKQPQESYSSQYLSIVEDNEKKEDKVKEIEPTVILPYDEQSEDTVTFSQEYQPEPILPLFDNKKVAPINKSSNNILGKKAFLSITEIADELNTSPDNIKSIIKKNNIKLYIVQGIRKVKKADFIKIKKILEKKKKEEKYKEKREREKKEKKEEYYTLEEILKNFNITQKDIKLLAAKGKIKVKKINKVYCFLKEDVDKVLKDRRKIIERKIEEDTYSIKEVLEILKITKEELKKFLKEKKLKLINKSRFKKEEVHKLKEEMEKKKKEEVDLTMVLPLFDEEEEEDDDIEFIPSPKKISKPQIPSKSEISKKKEKYPMQTIKEEKEEVIEPIQAMGEEIVEPIQAMEEEVIEPIQAMGEEIVEPIQAMEEEIVEPIQAMEEEIVEPIQAVEEQPPVDLKKYYSFKDALTELQLEKEELEKYLREGYLNYIEYKGEKYIKKTDVDNLKMEKMIEPTIISDEGSSDDDVLDDDDDIYIF